MSAHVQKRSKVKKNNGTGLLYFNFSATQQLDKVPASCTSACVCACVCMCGHVSARVRACALSTVTQSALISKLFLSVPGARRLISSLSRNKRKLLSFKATDEAKIFYTFPPPPSNRHRRTFNSDLKTLAEGGGENTSETLSACLVAVGFLC